MGEGEIFTHAGHVAPVMIMSIISYLSTCIYGGAIVFLKIKCRLSMHKYPH